jgi:5-methylcytosine-specific restriction endonuclease McrA
MSPTERQLKRIRRKRIRRSIRTKRNRHELKAKLLEEQNYRCIYCPTAIDVCSATFEHVRPKSRGGFFGKKNLVLACQPCNRRRGNKELPDFLIECGCSPAALEAIQKGLAYLLLEGDCNEEG